MDLKTEIQKRATQLQEEVLNIRRHLHSNPELSFEEKKTSEYIRKLLGEWQIKYSYPYAETGILAELEGEITGDKVIALRTDMDALPINELTDLPFRSNNPGVMHACGHDIHMACMLGTIKLLKSMRQYFGGKILFIFQPGEEKLPGGAKLMLEENIFKNHKPDLIIAQHVLPEMETGTVGFRPGVYMASGDEIFITVKGKGGHGALPEKIDDPVLMAAQILLSLQQEVNRRAPKGIPTVLSFGKVTADGAVNVIPDEVKLEGTFRTMDEEWRKKAHQLIEKVSTGIASGMGGTISLEIKHGYPVLKNNPEAANKAREYAIELLGKEHVADMSIRMTAEDFAWFSQKYPAIMYRLGVKPVDTNNITPLHTARFLPDEHAIYTGITTMTWLTLNFIRK